MDKSFLPYYLCTVSRKFFFFLDPLRIGRVRICDILASGFLESMLELQDPNLTTAKIGSNWFSLTSVFQVYNGFVALDADHDGALSQKELLQFVLDFSFIF